MRLWLLLSLAACSDPPSPVPVPAPPPDAPETYETVSLSDGLAPDASAAELFVRIARVFQHQRCANCHPQGDRPMLDDKPHMMNVQRGADGHGALALHCKTCHGLTNAPEPHQPPGAPNWHLAPREMGWRGKSAAEICAQLKDPKLTGDRNLNAVVAHVAHDPLVFWAWVPGPGRAPAPGSREELTRLMNLWIERGADCPK